MTATPRQLFETGLRARPDLVCRLQNSGGQRAWVVKDPVALRYFTLTSQEYAILQWLDGTNSLDDIRRKFEDSFPPQRITARHLQSFLANLHENGLIVAHSPGQGGLLLENFERQRWRERWQTWLNWLAIRVPGFDPDRFLSWLYPKVRWCFSRLYLLVSCLLVFAAMVFVAVHFAEFQRQLPDVHELVSPRNLIWMAVAFAGAKILHELGHALTCKHFGGECHEMGVMFLLFVPCLYCNVTDSWMLQSRWQRIAVSAAGMIIEFQLAALAVFCWWFSQPGLVHTIALNTIVVCTIGTLFFNGNPLLRYDGYFILIDLLGIPNLWQESRSALKNLLAKWFLRPDAVVRSAPNERRPVLILYAVASMAYRVFIVVAIVLFLQRALVPMGLSVFIPIVIATFAVTTAVYWFGALRRFWSRPMAWRQFYLLRVLFAAAALATAAWILFAVPLPCHIDAPALLQPIDAHRIYVSTPGILRISVFPGDSVEANQVVARLDDDKLHRDVVRLTGELNVARTRVESLRARLTTEPEAAAQLEIAEEMLVDVERQLQQRQKDEQALTLTAPAAGVVMEPPEVPSPPSTDQRLPSWTGTPLETKNARCLLERGTLLCLVGDPTGQEAVLFIDETDVQYVRLGQRVRLDFAVAPAAILAGEVVEIAKRNILTVPHELAMDQELANRPDATGSRRPVRTSYSVRVALEEHSGVPLFTAARGQAKILVESQSLAERLLRSFRRTFTVDL